MTLITLALVAAAWTYPQTALRISDEDKPAFTRDDTAVRTVSNAQIVANNGLCLDVTKLDNGDFRENKVPILLQPCTGGLGQSWDLITQGKHIHDRTFSGALLVSNNNQHCVDSNTPGALDNIKGALFACGGRAVGDGDISGTQTIFFNNQTKIGDTIAFPFTNNAPSQTGPGQGNTCLTVVAANRAGMAPCDGLNPAANQRFTLRALQSAPGSANQGIAAPATTAAPATAAPAATTAAKGNLDVGKLKGLLANLQKDLADFVDVLGK
ncbi:hypothetical protein HDU91_000207 [Kappamyces sp. JEL0680]|nr:hypothetical protein HDU91_000207 [Kappamyces sp. JEL0680]